MFTPKPFPGTSHIRIPPFRPSDIPENKELSNVSGIISESTDVQNGIHPSFRPSGNSPERRQAPGRRQGEPSETAGICGDGWKFLTRPGHSGQVRRRVTDPEPEEH